MLNCWFRRRSKKTSNLRVTGLCAGNSPVTGEYPAQRASNAENVSIWWRHHGFRWRRVTCLQWNKEFTYSCLFSKSMISQYQAWHHWKQLIFRYYKYQIKEYHLMECVWMCGEDIRWLIKEPMRYTVKDMSNRECAKHWSNISRASWRHKSTTRLFVQQLNQAITTKNIKAPPYLILCEEDLPVTVGFPSQKANNPLSVSLSWRHHDLNWWNQSASNRNVTPLLT